MQVVKELDNKLLHRKEIVITIQNESTPSKVDVTKQIAQKTKADEANIVIENNRTEDLFARYGGEEFIIMPRGKVNKEFLYIKCEHIRKAIEAYDFRFDDVCVRISASFGFHIKEVDSVDIKVYHQCYRRVRDYRTC